MGAGVGGAATAIFSSSASWMLMLAFSRSFFTYSSNSFVRFSRPTRAASWAFTSSSGRFRAGCRAESFTTANPRADSMSDDSCPGVCSANAAAATSLPYCCASSSRVR